jgi:hypothetical protein
MYCQACGAENTEDARFCNMCGSRFAQAGEAGGPLDAGTEEPTGAEAPAPAGGPRNDPNATVLGVGKAEVAAAAAPKGAPAGGGAPAGAGAPAPGAGLSGAQQSPFGGDSMLGVTLGGIGVQSAKKAWVTVLAVAAFLVAAGALATWLAMRGSDEGGGHAEADDPFVLGMPLTEETERVPEESSEGDPTPEDIDFVTGMGGSTTSAGSMGGTGSSSTTRRTTRRTGSSSTGSTGSSTTGSTMTGSTGGSNTGSTMTGSSGGSTGGSTGGSMDGTMESGMDSTGGSTDTTMESGGTGGGTGSLPDDTETAPEERDLEMELYGSRVRYVVRRYYAGRAQNCFDRATRNDPSVSGTVVIAMTIGAEGEVSRARVQRNTTGNEALGNCLSSQVGTWRLPPPPGGSLDMTMPFSR